MQMRETFRDLKLYNKIRELYSIPGDETMPSEMTVLLRRLEFADWGHTSERETGSGYRPSTR